MHWKDGHKELCPVIKRRGGPEVIYAEKKNEEAVAVAAEKCAEDTKGQTCYICTQALHWKTKEGLGADVARLALRVVRAFLDGDREGLLVFFFRVNFFRAAAALDDRAQLLVAALPVRFLAVPSAIASLTHAAARCRQRDLYITRGALRAKHY